MKKIGIIGASGYAGSEIVRILRRHSGVEIKVLNSETYNGQSLFSLYPEKVFEGLVFTDYSIPEINQMKLDLVFLAVPNGEAMKLVPKLKCKVVDLSADYRFKDKKIYEKVYGIKHEDLKTKAVYGLPELFREKIKKAKLVANPGCYATSCILGAYPLLESKLVSRVIFDSKSGYSGAGKKALYVNDPKNYTDNIIPYNISRHRHKYEIEQFIKTKVSFTPHVLPTFQGILSTIHMILKRDISAEEIKNIYKDFYKNENFVKIVDDYPDLHGVQKTNLCRIGGFEIDETNQLVVLSTLDNLIKGAAGQAVQNMNLMLGFNETEGLLLT
jgi:N-acetyl-gamma-glutamyl-phosphate reductase